MTQTDQAAARKRVALREQEIGRLSTLVEMGRDVKTQTMLDAHDANVRAITQMQGQVDMLNEQLAAREQELETLRTVEGEAQSLHTQVERLNRHVKRVERTGKEATTRVTLLEAELSSTREGGHDTARRHQAEGAVRDDAESDMSQALRDAEANAARMRGEHQTLQEDYGRLEEAMAAYTNDKSSLGTAIEALTAARDRAETALAQESEARRVAEQRVGMLQGDGARLEDTLGEQSGELAQCRSVLASMQVDRGKDADSIAR